MFLGTVQNREAHKITRLQRKYPIPSDCMVAQWASEG